MNDYKRKLKGNKGKVVQAKGEKTYYNGDNE
jgi:hypothetical protein